MEKIDKFNKIVIAIAALITPIFVGVIGNQYQNNVKIRETSAKYVELSIDILRETPNEDNYILRDWAIKILDEYSEIKLDESLKVNLLKDNKISFRSDNKTVPIVIHFYNGSNYNEPGIGEKCAAYLSGYSSSVINFTGFSTFNKKVLNTYIVDKDFEDGRNGRMVAKLLGIDESIVKYDPNFMDDYSNVKIVIGNDYISSEWYNNK